MKHALGSGDGAVQISCVEIRLSEERERNGHDIRSNKGDSLRPDSGNRSVLSINEQYFHSG